MNGPNDLDDGWAELARELGLEGDRPFPTPAPDRAPADLYPPEDPAPSSDDEEFVEEPGEAPTAADVYSESESDGDADDSDSGDDGEDAEGEGDGEGEETTGEPGEPKKKRRRRRRRKKKPTDGTPVPATADPESTEESDESAESADTEEDAPVSADGLVEEEGATPAATRELIANWDVPSWETIVSTMLFRPQGR